MFKIIKHYAICYSKLVFKALLDFFYTWPAAFCAVADN